MRILLLFFILIVFAGCKKDLLHWQQAAPLSSGTSHRLNDILFVNDSDGYICGGDRFAIGDLLITHDGGHTWTLHNFPEYDKEMIGLARSYSGTVYTIGYEGKLLFSRDGFATYTFKQMGEYKEMKALACRHDGHLIYIGGISFDVGYTAIRDSAGEGSGVDILKYELNKIRILPSGTGFLAGYGVMLKTTDEGNAWTIQNVHNDNFTGMDVHNEDTVYTCGTGGSIFSTCDGGANWQRLRNGDALSMPRYRLQDVLMLDAQHGYCVGDEGVVIYTDDAGQHWSELDRFTSENLYRIVKLPDGNLLTCGSGGVLYRLQR